MQKSYEVRATKGWDFAEKPVEQRRLVNKRILCMHVHVRETGRSTHSEKARGLLSDFPCKAGKIW